VAPPAPPRELKLGMASQACRRGGQGGEHVRRGFPEKGRAQRQKCEKWWLKNQS